MIASFVAGVIVGASVLLFIASRFVDKAKPQAASVTPSAIGMDLSGTAVYRDGLAEVLRVFREPEGRA
jgi:hypothetical protein